MTKTEMKKITTLEYEEANHGLPRLQALVAALENVDRKTVSNNVDAFAEIYSFKEKITVICNKYQEVVSHGRSLYLNRDDDLINKITTRMMAIPNDINLLESTFKHKIRAHSIKVNELGKQGLSQAEIEHVCPPITDHKKIEDKIKALRIEEKALHDFLNDSPIYDVELLKNTSVYPKNSEAA